MVKSVHSKIFLMDSINELKEELELLKTSKLPLSEIIAMQLDIKKELEIKQCAFDTFYK